VALAVGVDLCATGAALPSNAAMVAGNLEAVPLRTASVDLVISRSVLEHLEHPETVFREFSRVLRSGGTLVFTTPNKYYYSCLISRLLPEWVRDWYFRTAFGEEAYDHFPVYYRVNTIRAFKRLASATGFTLKRAEAVRHFPYYLMFSPFLFRLGITYDRLITSLKLDGLQSNWLVVMERS
jgi:ubiquinone/menaquinone biosynthesis C-methylase UbiE